MTTDLAKSGATSYIQKLWLYKSLLLR